jgi:hypothetical protein
MPTAELQAEEPAAVVERFWRNIRLPSPELLVAQTRRDLSTVGVETFSFDMVDDALSTGEQGESPAISVEAGTPRPVVKAWNEDKLVGLFQITRGACRAAVGNDVAAAARDFKACALPSSGEEGIRCSSGTHVGDRLKRMNPPSFTFVLAIPIPTGEGVVKHVFSRPVMEESDLVYMPPDSSGYKNLMSCRMEPRVWKMLF